MTTRQIVCVTVLAAFSCCLLPSATAGQHKAAISAYLITENKAPFTLRHTLYNRDETLTRLKVYPAADYDVHLKAYIVSEHNVTRDDEIVFAFRELFTGNTVEYARQPPLGMAVNTARAEVILDVHFTPEEVQLEPGFYHVRVDLVQDGRCLTQSQPGSTYFYLAAEDESLRYIIASYWLGHFSFLLDPETNALVSLWPEDAPIPASWDPFDASTREIWLAAHQARLPDDRRDRRQQLRDQKGIGELVGDCGQGLLFGWYTLHKMGHKDRAEFAQKLFDRASCDRLFKDDMVHGDNYFCLQWLHQAARPISQACILFHDDPEYGQWAEETFEDLARWMYSKYRVMKLSHNCAIVEEGVYVGRVFSGKAFFQLAHRLHRGTFYPSEVDPFQDLLAFAMDEAKLILENDGFFHDKKAIDVYHKCGNLNMACGFAPMLHLARETGHDEEAEVLAEVLRALIHAASTVETRPAGWMLGDAFIICEMALRLLGDDPVIKAYRDDCIAYGDGMPGAEQRYNHLASMILNSPEWKQAVKSGKDWRLLRPLPKPEPISWNVGFERCDVGAPPTASLLDTGGLPETLIVSDETAASGRRSVKFIDGSRELRYYAPELIYDLHFTKGTAVLSFDVRLEAGAVFRCDLRDERSIDGVGPSVVFAQGKLRVGDRELMEVREGQWFHVELEAPLGGDGGKFDIAVTLPGEATKRFEDLPFHDPGVFQAHRCFLSAYATEHGVFFLDNIHIEQR